MNFIKFLKSKAFLKQLVLAAIVLVALCFVILQWLKITTNHNEFEFVPNLKGKSVEEATQELEENNLVILVQDSTEYDPKYPKFSVLEQDPIAGEKVKENRKIYVTLNSSGYRKIKVPDLTQRTLRQVRPSLEALGFTVGELIYKDNIGKDMVLRLMYDGKEIPAGMSLPKTSKIDLVLGNGKRP